MNYGNSRDSSTSNEDELDKLIVHGRYQVDEVYDDYIGAAVNYESEEEDDNTFTRVSEGHNENSRDKFDRSFSRLDFQNANQFEFHDDNLHKYYNLTYQQFVQLRSFYDEHKASNGLFCIKLLNNLLATVIEMRNNEIMASERDINRILSLVDRDKDGYINLTQLINLLSLLFAQEFNLKERIESVGFNRINLDNDIFDYSFSYHMTPFEADLYLDFLNEFYSPDTIGLLENDDQIDIIDFAENVTPFFRHALFVAS